MERLLQLSISEEQAKNYQRQIEVELNKYFKGEVNVYNKFIEKLFTIENKAIIKLILDTKLLNQSLIPFFYKVITNKNIRNINRFQNEFILILNHNVLLQLLLYDLNIDDHLQSFYLFYNQCKFLIPNIDDTINSNPKLFLKFYKDNQLKNIMSIDKDLDDEPIYLNTNTDTDMDPQPIEPENYFNNLNGNVKYPNVIFDLHQDEFIASLLREYKLKILANIGDITMNRVYRCEIDEGVFYIQILFNDTKKIYHIFIFEYFENYQSLKSKFNFNTDKLIEQYLLLIQKPVYVCVAYRDITITMTKTSEKIFVEKDKVFYKEYKYYGNYLRTSSVYQGKNILSILFLLYGLVLNDIECINTINKFGMAYNELFIFKLINATGFSHTKCPYCKLGFRLAKMKIPSNRFRQITNLELYKPETQKLIKNNKSLYYTNNEFVLENFNIYRSEQRLIGDKEEHYLNPSLHNLSDIVYEKIKTSRPSLAKKLVFDTNLLENIKKDIDLLPNKHLLNSLYMDKMENYNKQQKEELITEYYKQPRINYNSN